MQTKKRSKKTSIADHDPEILTGMARGPWASLWAEEQEEKGESFSGRDIYEDAPATPKWALKWATQLGDKIVLLNTDRRGRKSSLPGLAGLYEEAVADGFRKDKETFGFYLGMQSIGHGVAWDDDHSSSMEIVLPNVEFYRR